MPIENFSIVVCVPDRLTAVRSRKRETDKGASQQMAIIKENYNNLLHATFIIIILIYHGVTRDIVRGKGTVSLISSAFIIHRIKRSIPSPKPPCGTEP